jgi:hypothetical protein
MLIPRGKLFSFPFRWNPGGCNVIFRCKFVSVSECLIISCIVVRATRKIEFSDSGKVWRDRVTGASDYGNSSRQAWGFYCSIFEFVGWLIARASKNHCRGGFSTFAKNLFYVKSETMAVTGIEKDLLIDSSRDEVKLLKAANLSIIKLKTFECSRQSTLPICR